MTTETPSQLETARQNLAEREAELAKHRDDLAKAQTRVEELDEDASGVTEAQFNKARSRADYLRASLGGKVKAVDDAKGELQRLTVEDVLQKVQDDAEGRWGIDRIREARQELRRASDALAQIITEHNEGRRKAIADLKAAGVTKDSADPFVATYASPKASWQDFDRLFVHGEEVHAFAAWPDLCSIANETLSGAGEGERLSLNTPGKPNQAA